jgi:carbon-monoxide dehydrogenase iron sulfur subunit
MRSVFVNPERCIGCRQCEIACAIEHSASQDPVSAFLEVPVPRTRIHVEQGLDATTAFPNRCRHCDPAPCQQVCPTGAISRDEQVGVVLVDPGRCIGCAICAVVCPFDVITFHPLATGPSSETPVAVKCDGCQARLLRGEEPACVEACKVDALIFGELNELLAEGRLRETGAVLATYGARSARTARDPLLAWHANGHATTDLFDYAAAQGGPR